MLTQRIEVFSIEDFFHVWSKDVIKATIDKKLNLFIFFENNYCCKIDSHIEDPENVIDMRWEVYQKRDSPSFYLLVSNDENIYLKAP